MTRIVYATATSVDGFLADKNSSLDWLFAVEGGQEALARHERFMEGVTVQVEGSTTYRWILDHEKFLESPERWQTFYGNRKTYVFSSRSDLPRVAGADITFVGGPVADHIEAMLSSAGEGDVHLVGGGGLAAQFAELGRLDSILLSIAPVTLGEGAPLFPARFDSSALRLKEVLQVGQFIQAEYVLGRRSGHMLRQDAHPRGQPA